MLTEFKRDSARSELDKLLQEIRGKRQELELYDSGDVTTDAETGGSDITREKSKIEELKYKRQEVSAGG